ncbi:MAG: class I fructose-bisphosphate aldolase [Actinomycetota bacterium]
MDTDVLRATAKRLVAPGKGILAADESTGTIKKRLASIGVESSEDNRRAYRDLLITTPGLGEHISGVILFDETIRQSTSGGTPFPELLAKEGIVPGIKVDTGAKPLALFPGETVTEGLDGLRERLADYRELGAGFAKWRATILIGEATPTDFAIRANAHAMARYAALCQEAGIVPIVEPEVLMDGAHSIDLCEDATRRTLRALYAELADARVDLPGSLLKVNMVLSGSDAPARADHHRVAEATVRCLTANVPADVPGIVFLSGGQSDEDATMHLNEMNTMGSHPWELSFSYGRALQAPALAAWGGDPANIEAAQRALAHRAHMNGLARDGGYSVDLESSAT